MHTWKFLSTLSLRRATSRAANCQHRSHQDFYPRSPCGERRVTVLGIQHRVGISIHALLAESDGPLKRNQLQSRNFYPRSPCGERREPTALRTPHHIFLSTLSLRRATTDAKSPQQGERISIHALLAESDDSRNGNLTSHCYFYPRSPCGERLKQTCRAKL